MDRCLDGGGRPGRRVQPQQFGAALHDGEYPVGSLPLAPGRGLPERHQQRVEPLQFEAADLLGFLVRLGVEPVQLIHHERVGRLLADAELLADLPEGLPLFAQFERLDPPLACDHPARIGRAVQVPRHRGTPTSSIEACASTAQPPMAQPTAPTSRPTRSLIPLIPAFLTNIERIRIRVRGGQPYYVSCSPF